MDHQMPLPSRVVVLIEYGNGSREAVELGDWSMTRRPAQISAWDYPARDRFEIEGEILQGVAYYGDMPEQPERSELEAAQGVIEP